MIMSVYNWFVELGLVADLVIEAIVKLEFDDGLILALLSIA